MSRNSSFPTIIDQVDTIDISFLKKYGYLSPNQKKSGIITWKKYNYENRISIEINTIQYPYILKLSYICFDEKIEYEIRIISKISNLGKGEIFFFICPFAQKLCRKLYSFGRYFCHREAMKNSYYYSQTLSSTGRFIDKKICSFHYRDVYLSKLEKKYFKKYYKGITTKKYDLIIKKLNQNKNITYSEYEMLLVK